MHGVVDGEVTLQPRAWVTSITTLPAMVHANSGLNVEHHTSTLLLRDCIHV